MLPHSRNRRTNGRPVLAVTYKGRTPDRVATGLPVCKKPVQQSGFAPRVSHSGSGCLNHCTRPSRLLGNVRLHIYNSSSVNSMSLTSILPGCNGWALWSPTGKGLRGFFFYEHKTKTTTKQKAHTNQPTSQTQKQTNKQTTLKLTSHLLQQNGV